MRTWVIIICVSSVVAAGCASQSKEALPPAASSGQVTRVPEGLYTIQPGDTGAKIAAKHGLTLAELAAINPEVKWTKLRVGQVVRIAK